MGDIIDLGDGRTQPTADTQSNVIDLGDGKIPAAAAPETWAQYAGNPSHPTFNRLGAAVAEEGRRLGVGAYNAAKGAVTGDWFAPLAHQVGQETAANTATPATAGRVAQVAAMTTPGDIVEAPYTGALRRIDPPVPTSEELIDESIGGKKGYDAVKNMGVQFSIPHVQDALNNHVQDLYSDWILPSDAPRTYAKLSALASPPDGAVSIPLSAMESMRRSLQRVAADKSAAVLDSDREAARRSVDAISGFMENPPEEAVLAGPAAAAADALKTARGNYAASKRSDLITNTERAADLRTATANSGRNYDNTVRQTLRPLVDPRFPQRLPGFTPAERQATEDVVQGSEGTYRNALRTVGNLGGGGHGLGATGLGVVGAVEGGKAAGVPGAIIGGGIPLVGSLARTLENAKARNAVEGLAETLRKRSPLYQDRLANAPYQAQVDPALIAAGRAAISDNLQDNGNQAGYAKGGAVKSKSHEQLVSRLMRLAQKAQREEKAATKPILKLPDNVVTTALQRAQEAI